MRERDRRSLAAIAALALAAGCGDGPSAPTDPSLVGRIAYTGLRQGQRDIWVMNADGSGQTQLTHLGTEREPAFAPDGKQIAFTHDGAPDGDIWVMDDRGQNQRNVTGGNTDAEFTPAWSRDGTHLAYGTLNGPVKSIALTGYDRRTIGPGVLPDWTLDGTHLLLTGYGDPATANFPGIEVVSLDGVERTRVSPPDENDFDAALSPDGTRIAYAKRTVVNDAHGLHSSFRIGVMRADGAERRLVIDDTTALYRAPTWSPDGTHLAFMSTRGSDGTMQIWVVRVDGSGLRQLTHSAAGASFDGNSDPSWAAPAAH